jgi:signal transduction histidine kinase
MNSNALLQTAPGWILARFTRPLDPERRPALSAIILVVLLCIGVADYASGMSVSLAPFYFVPILLAVAGFGWRTAVGVALGSALLRIVGDLGANPAHALPSSSWLNALSTLVIFLFVVWIFSSLLDVYRDLERRVAERTAELMKASEQRRLLEHELLTVSSSERTRMGQELHDDICQHLVGTSLAAKVLAQRLAQQRNALAGEAETIVGLLEEGTGKSRQLARGLLLSAIEPGRLPEKLCELADEGSRSGVPCRFRQSGNVLVSDAGVAAELYRIAQEAMRNSIRHAEASYVEVALVGERDAITLTVEDDGRGLDDTRPGQGMGLPIMAQRAAYIGAQLSLLPMRRGTKLLCQLPTSSSGARP